ncbi:MAG: alpha/beta fold hydrolase [Anaerolineae bacterium]
MTIDFDALYADVPQKDAFRLFREAHPVSHAEVDGVTWEYIDSGQGEETVLLLVGGLRVADAAWNAIPMLEDRYRVITPTYPALSTMSALADGLAGLLRVLKIDRVHLLAGSFGGMLAQVYVRRHPQQVNKLILSTTAVLNAETVERYKQGLAMVSPLPPEQVAELTKAYMFDVMAPPPEMHAFFRAYLHELYTHRLSKAEVLSTYEALIDFAENIRLTADDWTGPTLVLESDDDATFNEKTRAAVRAMYPQAQSYVFKGAGHSPGTTQRDLYYQVVKGFLKGGVLPG